MSRHKQDKQPSGCGCLNIPISVILLILGGGYWVLNNYEFSDILAKFSQATGINISTSLFNQSDSPSPSSNSSSQPSSSNPNTNQSQADKNNVKPQGNAQTPTQKEPKNLKEDSQQDNQEDSQENNQKDNQKENKDNSPEDSQEKIKKKQAVSNSNWEKKEIRGIYISRYQITNNASEQMIRERVRYYHQQGFNTIIHGVWGNGCTMYNSEVMQQKLGYESCPNQFRNQWLNWLIDEAHQHNMKVHAYFEKGIKIDKNSPIFDLAIAQNWLVPGVDKTYSDVKHYLLDVSHPEVSSFYKNIVSEFVNKYPEIDAIQWDDYLGYHADLPGNVDRAPSLTKFVQNMTKAVQKANPDVSFDICHHNPYWANKYFDANWQEWNVDRAFIQAYNENNFKQELKYVKQYNGIAITNKQFHRLPQLIDNKGVDSILIFPLSNSPKETASNLNKQLNNF